MLLIVGTVRVGRLAEARPVMAAMVAASRAEDGCVSYAYAEDLFEPGLVRVTELWRDRASLDRHFASTHLATWRAVWSRLEIGDRALRMFEVDDGAPV